jgi:ABC-type transport system involved in multi-copper enzyme maturation permease subunit
MTPQLLLGRKEVGELLRQGKGLSWLLAVALGLSAFSLLLISDAELSLLDNAEALYDIVGLIIGLGALMSMIWGSDAMAGERERGTLVALLLTPLSRRQILFGKLIGQIAAWISILVIGLPYLWIVGSTGQNLGTGLVALLLFGTPVVLGYGCLAVALSASFDSVRASLLTGIVILLVSASPLVLGASLRRTVIGQWFDAVNPFATALNALDAIIIDSQPLTGEIVHLGVVLAWLAVTVTFAANRVGAMGKRGLA